MSEGKNSEILSILKKDILPKVRELDGKLASLKMNADESSTWEASVYQAVHSSRRQLELSLKLLEENIQ